MSILSFLRRHNTSHGGPVPPSVCLSNSDLVSETTPFSGFSINSALVLNTSNRARESLVKIGSMTLRKSVKEFMSYFPYFLTDLSEIRCRVSPCPDTQWW
jgi:hypothetical protein